MVLTKTAKKLQPSSISSFCNWIIKYYIFSSKLPVNSRKSLQFVLSVIALLGIQENLKFKHCKKKKKKLISYMGNDNKFKLMKTSQAITFIIFDPSILYLTLLPTISAGYTTSSSMASWTAVNVLVRGRWTAEPFFGGRKILLVAIKITSCHLIHIFFS